MGLPAKTEHEMKVVGVDGCKEGWFAVIAPARLPAAQVKHLHDGVLAAFNDPEVKAAMAKQENVINPGTPEAARAFLKSEQERFGVIAKKAGVQLD